MKRKPCPRQKENAISTLLRRRREEAGLSLGALAKALNVAPVTPFHWEHGTAEPRLKHARALEEFFGEKAETLLAPDTATASPEAGR